MKIAVILGIVVLIFVSYVFARETEVLDAILIGGFCCVLTFFLIIFIIAWLFSFNVLPTSFNVLPTTSEEKQYELAEVNSSEYMNMSGDGVTFAIKQQDGVINFITEDIKNCSVVKTTGDESPYAVEKVEKLSEMFNIPGCTEKHTYVLYVPDYALRVSEE